MSVANNLHCISSRSGGEEHIMMVASAPRFAAVTLENVQFNAQKHLLTLNLEDEGGERLDVLFYGVASFAYLPAVIFDHNRFVEFCGEAELIPSIYSVENSLELQELWSQEEKLSGPKTIELKHFLIPATDGVWSVLSTKFTASNRS